jgi:hypothetical protein
MAVTMRFAVWVNLQPAKSHIKIESGLIDMNEKLDESSNRSLTRADRIHEGSLIDVTNTAKEVGFIIPVAITKDVWDGNIQSIDGLHQLHEDQVQEALWECLMTLYIGLKHTRSRDSKFLFPIFVDDEDEGEIRMLKSVLGLGDQGESVITIMKREEELRCSSMRSN